MIVHCINIEWREDRLKHFLENYPQGLPSPRIKTAIDRRKVDPPRWWKQGKGAWGCYRSHLSIIESELNREEKDHVLIFEDDVVFSNEFSTLWKKLTEHLPDDWDMVYLGGNILKRGIMPPEKVNDFIWRPGNVNSTYAYAINKRSLQRVYHHLLQKEWKPKHHIDHHYGVLHETPGFNVYVPDQWLCGHGAMGSQIGSYGRNENWFPWHKPSNEPMIAVLGSFRGGTSCVAGVLHHLGIDMGAQFKPPNRANPTGFWEAQMLAQICRAAFKEPWLDKKLKDEQIVNRLRAWSRMRKAQSSKPRQGGKHPSLCMMVKQIEEAWGKDTQYISVNRPPEDVTKSLNRLNWGWCNNSKRDVPPSMYVIRDRDIEKNVDPWRNLTIEFYELLSSPEKTIDQICEYLEYEPSEAQRQSAIQFVDPTRTTYRLHQAKVQG